MTEQRAVYQVGVMDPTDERPVIRHWCPRCQHTTRMVFAGEQVTDRGAVVESYRCEACGTSRSFTVA